MANATRTLIDALRATADRLETDVVFQWAHMGACNCGHLAQTLTSLPREELHRRALQRAGDWGQQSVEYCAASGLPFDDVIGAMLEAGLALSDIGDLEKLSSPEVLACFSIEERLALDRRHRPHVVAYMRAWAGLLEARWMAARTETSGVFARASGAETVAARQAR